MEFPIIKNSGVRHNYFKLVLDISGSAVVPRPGQFYNLRCGEGKDPLLRRPFSMHRVVTGEGGSVHLEILYLVIGKGTKWLSERQAGETVDGIGPFGNGFAFEGNGRDVVIVSRGIGIAPLFAVGKEMRMGNASADIHVLLGGRTRDRVFYEEECSEIGEVHIYTDDGSQGFRGKAPDLLAHLIETGRVTNRHTLFACGPPPMLKDLAAVSGKFALRGQVALESHMGCGFGVCLSCAFPLKPGSIVTNPDWKKPALQWSEDGNTVYSLICKDGPVYDLQEVDWDEWLA